MLRIVKGIDAGGKVQREVLKASTRFCGAHHLTPPPETQENGKQKKCNMVLVPGTNTPHDDCSTTSGPLATRSTKHIAGPNPETELPSFTTIRRFLHHPERNIPAQDRRDPAKAQTRQVRAFAMCARGACDQIAKFAFQGHPGFPRLAPHRITIAKRTNPEADQRATSDGRRATGNEPRAPRRSRYSGIKR